MGAVADPRAPGGTSRVAGAAEVLCQAGYFPDLEQVPERVVVRVRAVAGLPEDVVAAVAGRSAERYRAWIREYLGLVHDPARAREIAVTAMEEAAPVRASVVDLVNVALEELVRAGLELPGFSTLDRMAASVRTRVQVRGPQLIAWTVLLHRSTITFTNVPVPRVLVNGVISQALFAKLSRTIFGEIIGVRIRDCGDARRCAWLYATRPAPMPTWCQGQGQGRDTALWSRDVGCGMMPGRFVDAPDGHAAMSSGETATVSASRWTVRSQHSVQYPPGWLRWLRGATRPPA
ncbi:DUF4158 domain-containing protein [Streptomyces sp. NPDC127084]|uniref:DUF4158 domain-containing protein n=1 Tax=Streptomyces sp. NPDC127084 TaxID=3347133 RepID=UPI003656C8A0